MKNANEQDWWIDATERPPIFYDLCSAFVDAGLCSWNSSPIYEPHPQSFALVAIATMKAAKEQA